MGSDYSHCIAQDFLDFPLFSFELSKIPKEHRPIFHHSYTIESPIDRIGYSVNAVTIIRFITSYLRL